jgi:hypothetical protein
MASKATDTRQCRKSLMQGPYPLQQLVPAKQAKAGHTLLLYLRY